MAPAKDQVKALVVAISRTPRFPRLPRGNEQWALRVHSFFRFARFRIAFIRLQLLFIHKSKVKSR